MHPLDDEEPEHEAVPAVEEPNPEEAGAAAESTPAKAEYHTGPHETDVDKIRSMFTVTTNQFGHKEAVFKSPKVDGTTKLKDTVKVTPSSSKAGPSSITADGKYTGRLSYWVDHKGPSVTLPNGLTTGSTEGGGSGASVGDGHWDVPTADEAFDKTLDQAVRRIARTHSRVNQMLTNTKEQLETNATKSKEFQENRIGKPCSFCGEKIDNAYDSFNGHQLMANGWCQHAYHALQPFGHWNDDVPEHEKGE